MFRATVTAGLLLALVNGCAPVKDSCDAFCSGLCDKMKKCNMGDTSETCPTSCEAGLLNTSICESARIGLQSYTCDKLQQTLDCAEYCTKVCRQGMTCGVISDEATCAFGCGQAPATCNQASISVRSCEQIKRETTCYVSQGEERPGANGNVKTSGPVAVGCGIGVGGKQGDLCRTSTDCLDDLACLKESGTCGACATNDDCTAPYSTHYCGQDHKCHTAQCLKDEDCKDYSGKFCSTATHTCTPCSKDCKGVCDPYDGCVQCTLDEHCDPASTCSDHVCRKRCQKDFECGNGECFIGHCTDPVGTPCDKTKSPYCGGAQCLNVDRNNLTVPGYCTRGCNLTDDLPCPTGYDCKNYDCVKI